LFAEDHPILDELRKMNLEGLSPIEALQELHRLRDKLGAGAPV
jgi:hypothetical protein